jgi:hypothetical protein
VSIKDAEFDKLLTSALLKAAELDYFSDMPSDEELDIQPSKRFQRKMARMMKNPAAYTRNAVRPVYMRALRTAAMFALVFSVLFGALMLHPVARANIINLISTWLPDRVVYHQPEKTGKKVPSDWTIDYIPEGFELFELQDHDQVHNSVYFDEGNRMINISIIGDSGTFHVDNERHVAYHILINGEPADVLESTDSQYASHIIWHHESSGMTFYVGGEIEIGELIKIAKSIK